jgi:heptosyltransferase-2
MADRPHWVFCSGLKRSGSTLQYQLAKAIVEESGRGVGLGYCEPEEWPALYREHRDDDGILVVKSHRYLPGAGPLLRQGRAQSVFIRRDLRDVYVSWMRKADRSFEEALEEDFLGEVLEDDFHWSDQPNTLASSYEAMIEDLSGEVERIAGFLGVRLATGDADRIADAYSLGRQKRRIESFDFDREGVKGGKTVLYDPDTLLHHNHVRSGEPRQWERELTPAQVAAIETTTGGWLQRHGYEVTEREAAGSGLSVGRRLGLRLWRWAVDVGMRLGIAGSPVVPGWRRVRRAVSALARFPTSVRATRWLGRPLHAGARDTTRVGLGEARRILVVRLDRIGDVVLTLPMLEALRRNAPEAELTLVVRPEARELARACPAVDRVLAFEPGGDGRLAELGRHIRAWGFAARHFWGHRPDLAIVPRLDLDVYHATVLAYLSGSPRRVAYSERVSQKKAARNAGYDQLVTDRLEGRSVKHEVERNLDVVRALRGTVGTAGFSLALPAEAGRYADAALAELGAEGPLIALGLGAGEAKRRWPVDRYVELGRWLVSELDARLVVVGGPGEEPLGRTVEESLDGAVLNLVGRTTLLQAAAVLERATLFIGNDTGVMHLAAAQGTPVVEVSCHALSGLPEHRNAPTRFGPWGVPNRVVRPATPVPPCEGWCQGREAHCILSVEVGAVRDAAALLVDDGNPPRHEPVVPLRSGT